MTTFRPDTSFPFLAIARKYHAPYAEVLRAAEAIRHWEDIGWWSVRYGYLAFEVREAILNAIQAEATRRDGITRGITL